MDYYNANNNNIDIWYIIRDTPIGDLLDEAYHHDVEYSSSGQLLFDDPIELIDNLIDDLGDEIENVLTGNSYNNASRPRILEEAHRMMERLQEIRAELVSQHHHTNAINLYANIPNVGRRNLVKGSTNTITMGNISPNTPMVNFQGESEFGRYYTRNTFNKLPLINEGNDRGLKQNPTTRQTIHPGSVVAYTANISGELANNLKNINTSLFSEGGKRKKTRKSKKSKRSKKTRKH